MSALDVQTHQMILFVKPVEGRGDVISSISSPLFAVLHAIKPQKHICGSQRILFATTWTDTVSPL